MVRTTRQVFCPRNSWTKVSEGSFWNLGRTYDLISSSNVTFNWRWFGSGIPFFQEGSDFSGTASISIPPSTYWRILVNPVANTTITVNPFGAGSMGPPGAGAGGGGGGGGVDRPPTRRN